MKIIILGGGCRGTQYTRWLLLARARGKISVEHFEVIDRNTNCKVANEIDDKSVRIINSDWVKFLSLYIEKSPKNTPDLLVPSHTAPHIFGQTFFELMKSYFKNSLRLCVSVADFLSPVGTPFEKKLEKGVVAVSMANWKCPANCTEPLTCPHFHTKRNWDLEVILKQWAKASAFDAFHVFPARHFAYAVSAIPAKTIVKAWSSIKHLLQKSGRYTIGIATCSACHGIVTIFEIISQPGQ